jgi:dihydrofolate reductase
MRKLKLQMQITADGFVAGPQGQLDWMTSFAKDERLLAFVNHLTDTSDTILLGRKMTPGFIHYWEEIVKKPESPEHAFSQKMVSTPKIVFSTTLDHVDGRNVRVEQGELAAAVAELKRLSGKDLIVYGGATFVSSLIEHDLIDELHLFVHPVAISDGMRIFRSRKSLTFKASTTYPSGVVVNTYAPGVR